MSLGYVDLLLNVAVIVMLIVALPSRGWSVPQAG